MTAAWWEAGVRWGQYLGPHWSGDGRVTKYGQVSWNIILGTDDRLPIEDLNTELPGVPGIASKVRVFS